MPPQLQKLVLLQSVNIEKPCMYLVASNSCNAEITNLMISSRVMSFAITTDLLLYGGRLH